MTRTGMGIHNPERYRFLHHVLNDLYQNQVLEYIGVIAGMKGVTITKHGSVDQKREW